MGGGRKTLVNVKIRSPRVKSPIGQFLLILFFFVLLPVSLVGVWQVWNCRQVFPGRSALECIRTSPVTIKKGAEAPETRRQKKP